MKSSMKKPIVTTIIAIIIMLSVSFVKAEVYKIVDEHGNVTYTDQQPARGAEPVDLPPLSVIERPEYQVRKKAEKTPENDAATGGTTEMTVEEMRKNYADFALISPRANESIWRPDIVITAAWKTQMPLQQGMMIDIYVDDEIYQTTSQQTVPLGALDRGEHKVSATLVDSRKRRIAEAAPITFSVIQPKNYPVRPDSSTNNN